MTDNNYVHTYLDNINPSPIAPRVCACDCARTFQPRRSDQFYINKKHADKDYHEKVRKPNQENQKTAEKHLRANDRACKRCYNESEGDEVIYTLEALKSMSLNSSYTIGHTEIDGIIYCMTYNYLIHIFKENGIYKVKIRKQ